jgi:hypothetical protein
LPWRIEFLAPRTMEVMSVEKRREWGRGRWWCVLVCEVRMRRGWAATQKVENLLDSHPRARGSGATRRYIGLKKLASSAGWARSLLADCPPGLADCPPGAPSQQTLSTLT